MDRRGFLKFLGGGLVATATMAEAGAFAEFLDWIKRKPVWSFPKPECAPLFDEISAATLALLREHIVFDNIFRDSPFQIALKAKYDGGTNLLVPFQYGKVA